MTDPQRARLILLTGTPGSGKTTLGRRLADHLRLPLVSRDDIRGGLFHTVGGWTDDEIELPSADLAVERFLVIVEVILAAGVTCVVEYVVGARRPADLERLRALADCIVIRIRCDDPMTRVVDRNRVDQFIARPSVLRAGGFADVDEHTRAVVDRMTAVNSEMRTVFPDPVLDVDTTSGYEPDFEAIVEFATQTR